MADDGGVEFLRAATNCLEVEARVESLRVSTNCLVRTIHEDPAKHMVTAYNGRLFKFPGDGKKLQNVDELIASTVKNLVLMSSAGDAISSAYGSYRQRSRTSSSALTGEIRAVVPSRTSAVDDLIHELPDLEIIASFSMGFNKIDIEECREKGIRVSVVGSSSFEF
ncbi:Glyoxylate/hydroxypyruvate reductase A HPR2 [Platanthera guangdongensis]|uniref:Glyoxylate/hydroxypyruvate reductase A HPR2 n=1 Tax=Platanthera guangdongensis TaxID=2320717 RepID=A0ABR2MT73_9ASPA